MNKKLYYSYYVAFIIYAHTTFICASLPAHQRLISISSNVEFYNYVNKPNSAVFVDFGATWCSACTKIKPTIHQLSLDKAFSNIHFLYVDADKTPDLPKAYGITALPAFCYFLDGKLIGKDIGAKTAISTQLRTHFAPVLQNQIDTDTPETVSEETTDRKSVV